MTGDLVKQSIAELQDIVRCRCHPAYKDRGMHDPDCECDSADAVQVVADRIEELDKACKEWAEVSQRNYQRAKAARTKLMNAWCALEDIKRFSQCRNSRRKAIEALAELKGEDRG